ncbi:MAG: hypothetical protein JWM21_4209 [Acidobacteria bacterium]|nr:hypothetical protein [Acidobacteriota bacterium]
MTKSFWSLLNLEKICIVPGMILLVLAGLGSAAGQSGSTALVEKVSGGAFIRHDAGAKPIKLDPNTDVARRLYPGEQVRCEPGGFLRLRVAGRLRDINGPSSWFTIPRAGFGQTDPLQKVLEEYGRRGGRDRGGKVPAVIVFSPSDGSTISPDTFSISWVPFTKECETSFVIQDTNADPIWRVVHLKGRLGFLVTDAARQALRKSRSKSDGGSLTLILTDSCGNETKLGFSVLAIADEKLLRRELARWQREAGSLTRRLGRAEVFTRYGMFPQAAAEYEAALAQAPESRELLIRTIVAQRVVGNYPRARELTDRLPAGTQVP